MKKLSAIALATLLEACSVLPQPSVTGTFQGDLPCADCEKIQAKLVLSENNQYQYDTVYIKNGKSYPFTDKGIYTKENGNIRLGKDSGSLLFKVNNTQAEVCDANGKPAQSGNRYVLQKIN